MTLLLRPPYAPMEAKRVDAIPTGDRWLFEPKWDGFRAIVFRDGDQVAIQSKAGQPLARYFPELVDAIRSLSVKQFVLDGEIVVPIRGRLSFDDLLLRMHPAESRVRMLAEETPAHYYVFDVLVMKSKLLATMPIEHRREKLETFFENVDHELLHLSPATTDRKLAVQWFEKFGSLGLDGVMAKRLGEPYHSGDRDGMVKVKHLRTADCVVGGFRYGEGTKSVGSLLLGLYDDDGRLVHIGHTSSIKKADRHALTQRLEALRGKNPFEVRVPGGPSRWASERSGAWEPVRPKLVCEVEYDYFSQGRFRHGSKFLRWRPDKKPRQCTMEQVLDATKPARGTRKRPRLL
ncbi:MAG: ATP-dependent DNA ligase [Acidobacteria bacterium]|nr:ATP-dependent DNA ligase [Acidobacteriota bacterium]MBV9475979.1 ATP-dependent DNA ligase [Acidobacteriota bacterium]